MRRDLHSVRVLIRLYSCVWCESWETWGKRKPEEFALLHNGWRDCVCLQCRKGEREEGLTMAKAMAR